MLNRCYRMLMCTTALALGAPVLAQAAPDAPVLAQAAPAPAEQAEDAAAKVEFLQAQVDALQEQITSMKKGVKAATPSWKGAPEFTSEAGFKFKLRGRLMYDIGYVDNPHDAVPGPNLGFNSRVRRARLGVEGALPGGFSYKAEVDFANNAVSWADLFLEYRAANSPWSVRAGHMETFQSLEQMTSSRHIMFLERAQMNDAFGHSRRLGGAVGYDKGDLLVRAGVFNDTINASFDNDEWMVGARVVYAPVVGGNQLHFGANYQHREFSDSALAFRYRARPFVQTTDVRFVDTSSFAAGKDDVVGIEAAGVFGPLHLAAEAQWTRTDSFGPGALFGGNEVPGTPNRLAADPEFISYYLEAGYWLTGETRGYKKGEWDRTKVLNPFDKGGWGALALTARYDYLDLSDAPLLRGGIGTSAARGGKQTGYLLSLVWQPIDYVRITTQYAHAAVEGGPFAAAVKPTATNPANTRNYNVDSAAMRIAFDF